MIINYGSTKNKTLKLSAENFSSFHTILDWMQDENSNNQDK